MNHSIYIAFGVICCYISMLAVDLPHVSADSARRLAQILATDSSFKVRLQAVASLTKLDPKRSVIPLIAALKDKNPLVRSAAASALGVLRDPRAQRPLRNLVRGDTHRLVRRRARRALAKMNDPARHQSARYYVVVGKIGAKSNAATSELAAALGNALQREFDNVDGVKTINGKKRLKNVHKFRKKGAKTFVIDGAITRLSERRSGGQVELSCKIRVSLATYPGNSLKAFYSGEASMAVSERTRGLAQVNQLYRDLIEGAARGARSHIVKSYLRNL